MAKEVRQPKKEQVFQKMSGEDFQEHVVGKKTRRKKQVGHAFRILLRVMLCVLALAVGFTMTEAMLQVSERPLPEGPVTTAPPTTEPEEVPVRPEPTGPPLHSVYIPLNMLDRRTQAYELMAQVEKAGSNAVLYPLKDSDGLLSYRSDLMQMRLLKASQKARYRTDWTLRDLKKKAEQRIIGVIHCFDDPLAAELMTEAAVLQRDTDSVPWKDQQGRRWLNPWSEAAQEYLLAVIREVIAYGADDILLCGVQFPDGGNLQAAEFPGGPAKPAKSTGAAETADAEAKYQETLMAARNEVLRSFLEQAKEAAGENATLYVMISAGAARDNAEELGGNLWESAADWLAVDTRDALWDQKDTYWTTRNTIPVVSAATEAKGFRDYLVLIDETISEYF